MVQATGDMVPPKVIKGTASAGVKQRPTKKRFIILTLISIGTMINYLDRTVLGIAAPSLSTDLALDPALMGVIFSAFSWSYVAFQIPGGAFLDRFGSRVTYTLSLFFWSLFTALQAFATGLYTLVFFRLGIGATEAPCFPANSRIAGIWFPQQERARVVSVYTVGEYLGLACFGPLLFWITGNYGWHVMFMIVGVAGMLFAFSFWAGYRDPQDYQGVNQAELDHIEAGGGLSPPSAQAVPFTWTNCKKLLQFRQIWGAAIGQFAGNTTLVFFLTWFPTYLVQYRGMGFIKTGFFAVFPFLAAAVGIMVGGWISDRILTKTGNVNLARKGPIICGLLLTSVMILANFVDDDTTVIVILSIAFFGQGIVGLGWTLIADMAPKHLMGLTGGLFNFVTNISGIVAPLVIGFLISATGSFYSALVAMTVVGLMGACSYIFLLGDVKRLEISLD